MKFQPGFIVRQIASAGKAANTVHATIIKTTETGVQSIECYGNNGKTLYFDWYGDGSVVTPLSLTGDGNFGTAQHDYASVSGEKTIKITGDLFYNHAIRSRFGNLTYISIVNMPDMYALVVDSNNISEIISDVPLTKLFQIYVNSNSLSNVDFATYSNAVYRMYLHSNNWQYPVGGMSWGASDNGYRLWHDNHWSSSAQTDRALKDSHDSTFQNMVLNYAGTNAARSSASDLDVLWLINPAEGNNSLTVNE